MFCHNFCRLVSGLQMYTRYLAVVTLFFEGWTDLGVICSSNFFGLAQVHRRASVFFIALVTVSSQFTPKFVRIEFWVLQSCEECSLSGGKLPGMPSSLQTGFLLVVE